MKKLTFMKDAVILCGITLISGFLLGSVFQVTKEPIVVAETKISLQKYQETYPGAADFKPDLSLQEEVKGSRELLNQKKPEYGKVEVNEVMNAVDVSGALLGHLITASSDDSYGGTVKVSIGIAEDGTITGVEILKINDTPGLGMKAEKPAFKDQYKDKVVDEFSVTKTGSTSKSEIQAISGATITSKAVTHAVDAALYFVNNCIPKQEVG